MVKIFNEMVLVIESSKGGQVLGFEIYLEFGACSLVFKNSLSCFIIESYGPLDI
jgi:hypothetical protein